MPLIPYVVISILGGLIVPLQLAMVNAFRSSTGASQIQSTFYLYLGGAITSLIFSSIINGGIKPPMIENSSWWMWLTGVLGSFYILFMFIAAPKIGSGNTLLWVFLGQMYFSFILSQLNLFGMVGTSINFHKVLGLIIITIGGLVMLYGENKIR